MSFRVSTVQKRLEKLLSICVEFLSCLDQPSSSWLELLGVLSTWRVLVPGGHLRMLSLQILLLRPWDRNDDSVLVRLGFRLSKVSGVVARLLSSRGGDLSFFIVPQPRFLVRRLIRGLGSAFGRFRVFRPLVYSGDNSLHHFQGVVGRGERFYTILLHNW